MVVGPVAFAERSWLDDMPSTSNAKTAMKVSHLHEPPRDRRRAGPEVDPRAASLVGDVWIVRCKQCDKR